MNIRLFIFIISNLTIGVSVAQPTTLIIKNNKGPIIKKSVTNNYYKDVEKIPNLDFCPLNIPLINDNCVFTSVDNSDTLEFRVYVCNYGHDDAIDLQDSVIMLMLINDTIVRKGLSISALVRSDQMPVATGNSLIYYMTLSEMRKYTEIYFCLRVHYKNRKNKKYLLEKMLDIDMKHFALNKEIKQPNGINYEKIKKILVDNKLW